MYVLKFERQVFPNYVAVKTRCYWSESRVSILHLHDFFLVLHNVLSLLQSRLKLPAASVQTCDCLVFHSVRTKMTNKNLTNLRKNKMEEKK